LIFDFGFSIFDFDLHWLVMVATFCLLCCDGQRSAVCRRQKKSLVPSRAKIAPNWDERLNARGATLVRLVIKNPCRDYDRDMPISLLQARQFQVSGLKISDYNQP